MTAEALRKFLSDALRDDLPGDLAHDEMSPPQRLKNKRTPATGFKEAAVAVVIGLHQDQLHFTVIQRPTYDGAHSGQIAFPGGKKDPSDLHLNETACRECFEEIGLSLDAIHHAGKLTPVYIPVSGFELHPYVYVIGAFPELIPDEREVEAIHFLRLHDLLNKDIKGFIQIEQKGNSLTFQAPCFHFGSLQIWGATAIVLNELKFVLKGFIRNES
jgi:8-oxo-dGTP pyrophosphatase MutT (NUDIX family)